MYLSCHSASPSGTVTVHSMLPSGTKVDKTADGRRISATRRHRVARPAKRFGQPGPAPGHCEMPRGAARWWDVEKCGTLVGRRRDVATSNELPHRLDAQCDVC